MIQDPHECVDEDCDRDARGWEEDRLASSVHHGLTPLWFDPTSRNFYMSPMGTSCSVYSGTVKVNILIFARLAPADASVLLWTAVWGLCGNLRLSTSSAPASQLHCEMWRIFVSTCSTCTALRQFDLRMWLPRLNYSLRSYHDGTPDSANLTTASRPPWVLFMPER